MHPNRIRVVGIWLFLVLISNIIILQSLEGLTFIEAIYFIVITLTTVGYGDIYPQEDISRIFIVILIISFLGSLATLSENIIFRLIRSNQENQSKLDQPISLTNHVIVIGSHPVAKKVVELLSHRLIPVVYLSSRRNDLSQVAQLDVPVYLLDGQDPFPKLNVTKALAMYLALGNDDDTIKYSVQVKHINPDMLIYALTERHMKENYFKYLNMNRSFTIERILSSYISMTTRQTDIFPVPDQLETDAKYIIFILRHDIDPRMHFRNFRSLEVNNSMTRILNYQNITIAVPRLSARKALGNLRRLKKEKIESLDSRHNRIFLGGYNSFVKEVLDHLTLPLDQFTVITFYNNDRKLAEEDGLSVFHIEEDEFPDLIDTELNNNDLIINFFPRLSDSLYSNAVVLESGKKIETIQIIYDDFEVEIFERMGVDRLVQPFINTTRSMIRELLKELKLTFSIISTDHHSFEMIITNDHPYLGKSSLDLVAEGYDILFVQKHTGAEFEIAPEVHMILEEGDSLFVRKSVSM